MFIDYFDIWYRVCLFYMDFGPMVVTLSNGQISPTEIRGALGSVNQIFICIGILAALVAGLPLVGNPIWYVCSIQLIHL